MEATAKQLLFFCVTLILQMIILKFPLLIGKIRWFIHDYLVNLYILVLMLPIRILEAEHMECHLNWMQMFLDELGYELHMFYKASVGYTARIVKAITFGLMIGIADQELPIGKVYKSTLLKI